MSGIMVLVATVAFAGALMFAAIGLFRFKFWGWINALVCGGVAMLVCCALLYTYFYAQNGPFSVLNEEVARIEWNEQARLRMEQGAASLKSQVNWTFFLFFTPYAVYASAIAILLFQPYAYRAYRA